jgi:hypothetical protein
MKDILLVTLAILSLANAVEAKSKATPAPDDTTPVADVEGLSVAPASVCVAPRVNTFAARPKIVSTYPAYGATVRPGVLVVRVTFDQPMSCKGFFTAVSKLKNPCPDEHQHWVLSFDRSTIRTVCRTAANVAYGVGVGVDPDAAFLSLSGRPPEPFAIRFTTSLAQEVLSTGESLNEDPASQPPKPEFTPLPLQEAHVKK